MSRSWQTVDRFFSEADSLRKGFEDRFRDPRAPSADRFIWDYWHVPGQYTALRTPAYHFFQKSLYDRFHNELVWWGRRNLGCHDVSPPWMSCYLDGFGQELHGDLPHGPWAFVYSLTPWQKRRFIGGETILLRDEILSYWQGAGTDRGLEREDVETAIPALFNRLTVFDPRIPHGVRRVEGVRDLLEGRLVIHGWFVQPRPFIEGPLKPAQLQSLIDDVSGSISDLLSEGLEIQGVVSLRFQIERSGEIKAVKALSNSLRHPRGNERIEKELLKHLRGLLGRAKFPKQRAISQVTLPLVFAAD